MAVKPWVKEMVEHVVGSAPFKVGDRVKHPDGRLVQITSGQYWGEHGISNHWSWREVLPDGSLSGKEEHGYGWEIK
jgi:hypothetical protein